MEKQYIDMWGAVFSRPVFVSSDYWNGWAVPYFTDEDLPALIQYMNEQEFTGAPYSIESNGVRGTHADVNCCEKGDKTYLECVCLCDECVDYFPYEYFAPEFFEGRRVVSVGGYSWCWSITTPEELADM